MLKIGALFFLFMITVISFSLSAEQKSLNEVAGKITGSMRTTAKILGSLGGPEEPIVKTSQKNTEQVLKGESEALRHMNPDQLNLLKKLNESLDKLLSIGVGCELDEVCIMQVMAKLIKAAPQSEFSHNLSTNLTDMQSRKQDIEDFEKQCRIPPINIIMQEAAACRGAAWKIARENNYMLRTQAIFFLDLQCRKNKIQTLADNGNIYAQSLMASFFSKGQDVTESKKWSTLVESHTNVAEKALFEKCEPLLHMLTGQRKGMKDDSKEDHSKGIPVIVGPLNKD